MGTLRLNTIQNPSGTTAVSLNEDTGSPTLTSISNTSTYNSDSGAVNQNLVQAVTKSWVNFDGTGTPAPRDSLNVTSITDGGTGIFTVVLTNAMSNDDYSRTGSCGENADSGGNRILGLRVPSTGSYNVCTYNTSAGLNDNGDNCSAVHGDLA